MTEAEWFAATDPEFMLGAVDTFAHTRKFQLFSCACCRRIWHLLIDERSRLLIETAEQYADGLVSIFELSKVREIHQKAQENYDFKAPCWAAEYASLSRRVSRTDAPPIVIRPSGPFSKAYEPIGLVVS
jgi:hypothetical protein